MERSIYSNPTLPWHERGGPGSGRYPKGSHLAKAHAHLDEAQGHIDQLKEHSPGGTHSGVSPGPSRDKAVASRNRAEKSINKAIDSAEAHAKTTGKHHGPTTTRIKNMIAKLDSAAWGHKVSDLYK